MKLPFALVMLLLVSTSFGQQTPSPSPNVKSFLKVKDEGLLEPEDVEFSVSGYKYFISGYGKGRREGGNGPVRRFDLRLNENFLNEIYYADYQGDVLLNCEYSDSEYGASFITRLNGKTMAMKWKRGIRGFNLGQGLIEDKFAYVTALGLVAKVNLETGAFVWKHDNLYRTASKKKGESYSDTDFNSFELPEVKGDIVSFKEVEIYPLPPKTLSVQKRTGRIVSIK
jgi:hypothetical protein